MFEQLTESPPEETTPMFEQVRASYAQDPFAFDWNFDVPDVTMPWPTIEDPEPMSIRDAIQILSRRQDVTDFLYSIRDLEVYTAVRIESKPCDNCGTICADKWCGLRGDDEDGDRGPAEGPVTG